MRAEGCGGAPRRGCLRKAAGQWLIDLGVPLELVSRALGHADTRITETVYAKIKDEDRNADRTKPESASRGQLSLPL